VNNAGAIYPDRRTTVDGFEMTWQVDHLAPFLLTNLLRPALDASGHSQVITISSDAHLAAWRGLRFDDLNGERSWSPFGAYAAAKLANIMFSAELARRWRPSIRSNAVHPGVVRTGFGRGAEWPARRRWAVTDLWALSAAQGADTLVYLASSPDAADANGAYFYKRRPKRPSRAARHVSSQQRLWEASATALGMDSA
jgi:NAD(P)-dependent dehydrogenase (short-subunit alcohol dehydrogenase family)